MALLAGITLGSEVAAEPVTAEVRADGALPSLRGHESFRLIVQSYDARATDLRAGRAKPVGSMQRVVSAEEIRRGISIDFVELRDVERGARERPLVVAWLEPLAGSYDLDAREARPRAGSVIGFAHRDAQAVAIRLDRRAV